MNTYHIEEVFGTRGRVAVLRVLAGVAVPLSIRQVATAARISHVSALEALNALVGLGVVASSIAGRSHVHWLERRNVITRDLVLPAFGAEADSSDALLAELRSFIPGGFLSAVLFGSYARGDTRPESDVDVLLVGSDRRALDVALDALSARAAEARAVFGATLSVVGYTLGEVNALRGNGSFVDGVLEDGIAIYGAAPYEWGDLVEGTKDGGRGGGRGEEVLDPGDGVPGRS
jgi:predicted nucleotidyltransferase